MNKILTGLLLLTLSASISSCSFHHLVAGRKARHVEWPAADSTHTAFALYPQPDTVADVAKVAIDTTDAIRKIIDEVRPVWQERLVYNTFSGKAKVHFEGPDDKQEFTAHIRVRKDSVIWINVTALGGILFAKLLVTPDSFFMTKPMSKEAVKMPLSAAARILPTAVDFSSLQNLIVGEPLRSGTIKTATSFGGSWSLEVEDSGYLQRITYNKADSTLRMAQIRTRRPDGPQAMTEYGSYTTADGRKVSTARVINIQNGADVFSIDMNFQKVDFDEPLDYPFSIPASYEVKGAK
jgi:Domain of unknown function (DUF4292)